MTYLESILLGALEGLTEFLPVSSTGHLILASSVFEIAQTDAFKSFEIAIQLGSILAVLILFWRHFLKIPVLLRLAVAFIPTGLVGLFLYRFIKDILIGNTLLVVVALFLGGLALILVERSIKPRKEESTEEVPLTLPQSFFVGCAQAVAVIPGVSRSGATILGGLLMGIPRTTILTFSFLLAVPTMIMATVYDLYKTPEALFGTNLELLVVGFVSAFVVALFTIR
ncbi:MAG: undecaprenyl-diphosphate phosphatase, partial [Minisyncoccia bacterium]